LHSSGEGRLSAEIGTCELSRCDTDSEFWSQQLESGSKIPGLRDVRYNGQREISRPPMDGERRQRQGASARDHAADRETGRTVLELCRQCAEVWERKVCHRDTDLTVLILEVAPALGRA
jgi:hypothetical protein